VVLLGRDAPLLAGVLEGCTELVRVETLDQAVAAAAAVAKAGDVVLLSPACASLDMFSNFEERGRLFAAAARELTP